MTKHLSILLASGLLFCSHTQGEPPNGKTSQDVDFLIKQLSHPDFSTREKASKEIWELGVDAVPPLEKAVESKDPEVAARAKMLIRNIAAGILPNTPPEIAELIDKYSKNNINGKLAILRELSDKRAYKQMLHMFSWEKNKAHRDLLLRDFRNVGLLAARQSILEDDVDEAIELLKLSPRDEANLRALAFLLKRTGKIDDEIARIHKFKVDADIDGWMKILLQIKGDKGLLKEFAKAHGDKEILSTIAALEGNPMPAIDVIKAQLRGSTGATGLDVIRMTALGTSDRSKASAKADKLIKSLLKNTDPNQKEREIESTLRVFFASGYHMDAGELFRQYSEEKYFYYLDSYEKPEDALKILGVPSAKDKPNEYHAWVKEAVKLSLEEDEISETSGHQDHVLNAATFYFSRGEKEIARTTLKALLIVLEKEGLDRWYEVVRALPESGMSEMAVEFALERGNEDNDLERLVNAFYGDSIGVDRIWKSLRSRENTIEKDFMDMAVLMGMYRDRLADGKKLEDDMLARAKRSGRNSYVDMLFSLAEAATVRNDMAGSLEYYRSINQLGKEVEARGNWKGQYREVAEGLQSWKDYITAYEAQEKDLRDLPIELSKYAISLKRVGRNKEGDKLLEKAITMTLSIPTEYNEIAMLLYGAGYEEKAIEMWTGILIGFKPSEWEFHYTIQYMGFLSKHYIHKKDWKMASALASIEVALGIKNVSQSFNPAYSLRSGYYAYFTNGMLDYQEGNTEAAVWKLKKAHDMALGDGLLADEFYPSMRDTDLSKQYDEWFSQAYSGLEKVTQKYPSAHNTHNTIAWLGARAVRKLDESLAHANKALELAPKQGAYLDTLAEIYFAKGDRKNAIKWSQEAVRAVSDGSMAYHRAQRAVFQSHVDLMNQLERFENGNLPSAEVKMQKNKEQQ